MDNYCAHGHCHNHHNHSHGAGPQHGLLPSLRYYRLESAVLLFMIAGILCNHYGIFVSIASSAGCVAWLPALIFFLLIIMPIAIEICGNAWKAWSHGDIFNEFTLMLLASAGAFIIGEYAEGVAVLLFYSAGEKLEDSASEKARGRIKSLIDRMPATVQVITADGARTDCKPEEVVPGTVFAVKPGERVALDGRLQADAPADFNMSAITGESLPVSVAPGKEVMSGSIPIDCEVRLVSSRRYADSSMSRMMKLIEEAASKKSRSETMLRRITRWYTPLVMLLAVLLFATPWAVSVFDHSFIFHWEVWLRRSLVLLVCSCPCALVVSVPLSYFAGIGAASRFGVLFKGSTYLDVLRSCDTLMMDKTGTVTTGDFHVSSIEPASGVGADRILAYAAALDAESSHPLARAVVAEAAKRKLAVPPLTGVVSLQGGMKGNSSSGEVIAGSRKLMATSGIEVPQSDNPASEICVAVGGSFIGAVYLEDTLKGGVRDTIARLHKLGIRNVGILSGDRPQAVAITARETGIDSTKAGLLPEQKQDEIMHLRSKGHRVIYLGDGINDAPSLASADVGIAIGTGGTDVAIDSADAVLAGTDLRNLVKAVVLARRVRHVVIENVTMALGVKAVVMILGAFGIASLWAAVFADSGIMLLTIVWTLLRLRLR